MHHADAQPRLHHRQDGIVVAALVANLGLLLELVQEFGNLVVLFLPHVDKVLIGQHVHREIGGLGHGVVPGEDGHQAVLNQKGGVQIVGSGQRHKAAVHQPLAQPAGNLVILPVEQVEGNVGVGLVEVLDNGGEQAAGEAGEGAHPDGAGGVAVQLGHRAVEGLVTRADDLELGQQHQPLGADFNAGPVPGEEGDPPALFQVGNHAADGGLGVAQLGGGPGNASRLDGLQIGDVFLNAHRRSFLSLI